MSSLDQPAPIHPLTDESPPLNQPTANSPRPTQAATTQIVSSSRGRVRLRVPQGDRHPDRLAQIANILGAHPQVHQVCTNPRTGSILIHHRPQDDAWSNILNSLDDLGIIVSDIVGGESFLPGPATGTPELAPAIADLNDRLGNAAQGWLDLRLIIPLGLALLALRQLRTQGWQFDLVPWYILAWYAVDSFIKLNNRRDVAPRPRRA